MIQADFSGRFVFLEFLKVTRSLLYLFNRWPKCFACGSPPTRCTKECSSSTLFPYLSYTPLNSWILFVSTISFEFYHLDISNRYERGIREWKNFFERRSTNRTQVRQSWRNFLKISIKKKKKPIYSNIFSITSVYNVKIKYFRMHRQLTMHASIVRTWSVSKDWIVSFFQRNRDSRDNSVMDIYISNFANAILCVVLYTFRDN